MANTLIRWQPFAHLGELRSRFARILLCRVARAPRALGARSLRAGLGRSVERWGPRMDPDIGARRLRAGRGGRIVRSWLTAAVVPGPGRRRHAVLSATLTLVAILVLPGMATAVEDTTPPELTALSVDPTSVDVTAAAKTVKVTATITDDLSGVPTGTCGPGGCEAFPASINFASPSRKQFGFVSPLPTGGDQYEGTLTIPRFAEAGDWKVDSVSLTDRAGNRSFLSGSTLPAVARNVTISVTSPPPNMPPNCSTVTANPRMLWPPNHKLRLVTLSGATDPDGDPVTLTITAVTQDEPLNGLGDGDKSPDARAATQSNKVLLRAERSGRGDGRVYRVSFVGSDGKSGSCSGVVKVGVPKSMGAGSTPIDSAPPIFGSLGP